MPKFLVLYQSSVPATEMMANVTPEQRQAGMEAWMEWAGKWGSAISDMGSPLGNCQQVSGQTVTSTSSPVTGYSIVEADSAAAAAKMFVGHPHFLTPAETSIDVLECLPMPGS
jgi:hypothetical protein